jgi:hypothetical protein
MPAVDFVLDGLNTDLSLDLSGALVGQDYADLDVSATAVYYVKTSDMRKVFKFQTDSFDVTDDSADDIKYYVHRDSTAWPTNLKLNPANAAMVLDGAEMLSSAAATKNKLKHDFVRYLAFRLFNTIHGVDLFSNEEDLLASVVRGGRAARLAIETKLNDVAATNNAISGPDVSGGHYYTTNALDTSANICRVLMRQLIHTAPGRFETLSVDNSGNPISVPLEDGDNLNFKVTVAAASGQETLVPGVSPIVPRSYGVKIILAADPVAPATDAGLNVTPVETETGTNVGEYPYYTA